MPFSSDVIGQSNCYLYTLLDVSFLSASRFVKIIRVTLSDKPGDLAILGQVAVKFAITEHWVVGLAQC